MRRGLVGVGVVLAVLVGWFRTGGTAPAPAPAPVAVVGEARAPTVARQQVRCADTLGLPPGAHELIELFGPGDGQLSEAVVSDGQVALDVVQPSGRGGLYVIGWQTTIVAWEGGVCRFLDEGRAFGAVVGEVTGFGDLPAFAVNVLYGEIDPQAPPTPGRRSGMQHASVDDEGGFYVELPVGPTYRFQASHNGDWPNPGEPIDVVLVAGHDTVLTLELPETAGGLGLLLEPESDGVVVKDVLSGTPAARAGVRTGDVVLEVDGVPVNPDLFALDRPPRAYSAVWRLVSPSGEEREVVVEHPKVSISDPGGP